MPPKRAPDHVRETVGNAEDGWKIFAQAGIWWYIRPAKLAANHLGMKI